MICCPLLLRAQHVAVTGKVTGCLRSARRRGDGLSGRKDFQWYRDGRQRHLSHIRSRNATLVFSYLGYRTESVKVAGKTEVDVVLEEDKLALDAVEVVSVGYGSVARRDLTGSVSKVEMDELLKTTNSNFDRAIAGKIAGVVVTSPTDRSAPRRTSLFVATTP